MLIIPVKPSPPLTLSLVCIRHHRLRKKIFDLAGSKIPTMMTIVKGWMWVECGEGEDIKKSGHVSDGIELDAVSGSGSAGVHVVSDGNAGNKKRFRRDLNPECWDQNPKC